MAKRFNVGDEVAYKARHHNSYNSFEGKTGVIVDVSSLYSSIRWDHSGATSWTYNENLVPLNPKTDHDIEIAAMIAEADRLSKEANELLDKARELVNLRNAAKKLGYMLIKV